jgi:hypothetical protein
MIDLTMMPGEPRFHETIQRTRSNTINGTKIIKIFVSKEDRRRSKPKDPNNCAAAISCRRLPEVLDAQIYLSRSYLLMKDDMKWHRLKTPNRIQKQMVAFDQGVSFQTGEYEFIPLYERHRATGKTQGGDREGSGKKDGTRSMRHRLTGLRVNARS